MSWEAKTKELIAEQCLAAWREVNPPSRKRHKPYRVPELARAMVKALDANDEHEAKRLMIIYRTGAVSLI